PFAQPMSRKVPPAVDRVRDRSPRRFPAAVVPTEAGLGARVVAGEVRLLEDPGHPREPGLIADLAARPRIVELVGPPLPLRPLALTAAAGLTWSCSSVRPASSPRRSYRGKARV